MKNKVHLQLLPFLFLMVMSFNVRSQKILEAEITSGVFNINGNFDEPQWKITEPISNKINVEELNCVAQGQASNNIIEPKFGVFSTANYLYIGVKIIDDIITNHDAVNIYLSAKDTKVSNCPNNWPRVYDASDFQFIVKINSGEVISPQGANAAVDAVAVKKMDGYYALEMRIMWYEIDFLSGLNGVFVGRKIGFDIGYQDSDEVELANSFFTPMNMWSSCCTNRNWTETINFGNLVFVDNVKDSISWEMENPIVPLPVPITKSDSVISFSNPDGTINMDFLKKYSGKILSVSKISNPVNVDGNLDESVWRINNAINNNIQTSNLDCGENVPSSTLPKISGAFGALWDNKRLYIGLKVLDTVIGDKDQVHLFLSLDNDRSSNCPSNWPRAYTASTFQIVVNVKSKTVESPNGWVSTVEKCSVVQNSNGYSLEISLLWEELDLLTGASATEERYVGFDIGLIDNNSGSMVLNNLDNMLMWNQCCSNRNWTEATNFGLLRLQGERAASFVGLSNNLITSNLTANHSKKNNLMVVPNPSSGIFRLSNLKNAQFLSISNMYGMSVYSKNLENDSDVNIDVSNLPTGKYIIEIKNPTGLEHTQLLINK